ncbi:MAG TPA: phosphate propanoyltransferase [Selenomonadales bacterium]|nr:phosphate propanoyltransferase [Selenomonadales bacterium]
MAKVQIPVGISARHVHVSQEHLNILYGEGYQLQVHKELGQPGQYAAKETVDLVTEKGAFKKVRILGPVRKESQVELALTDAIKLGLSIPVRDSGDHTETPGLTMVGPKGEVKLEDGVIAACRHIHMTPAMAQEMGLKDKQFVKVRMGSDDRCLIFDKVLVRVHETFQLEMHIDTDEGNACRAKSGDKAEIVE